MPKKKVLSQTIDSDFSQKQEETPEDLILGDLDINLNDDDLLITTEETLTIITEDDEDLLDDEEFLIGSSKKRNKKNTEDDEIEDFDSYFYQEE